MDFITSFFETLYDIFTTDWIGAFFGSIIVLLVIIIVGMILWSAFYVLDSWFLPVQQGVGEIESRSYNPAHLQPMATTIAGIGGGVNTVVMQACIPESWSVIVRMDKRIASMECSEAYYNEATQGKPVAVHFVNGRLSSKFYIRSMS